MVGIWGIGTEWLNETDPLDWETKQWNKNKEKQNPFLGPKQQADEWKIAKEENSIPQTVRTEKLIQWPKRWETKLTDPYTNVLLCMAAWVTKRLRVRVWAWGVKWDQIMRGGWVRDLGFTTIYIYKEFFCNFRVIGSYPGWVLGRVSDFFDKIQTWPGLASGFFFFFKPIPDPILYRAR